MDYCQRPNVRILYEFEDIVHNIQFPDIAVPYSPEQPIRELGAFSLATLVSVAGDQRYQNYPAAARFTANPTDLLMTYDDNPDGKPHLDAGQAIGLVFRKHLIAISSGLITTNNSLIILQLQDVTGVRKRDDKSAYYKTGLHNGLRWTDSLVKAWETVADTLGVPVTIQSNANNTWGAVVWRRTDPYDSTAQRMLYVPNEVGNWAQPEPSQ